MDFNNKSKYYPSRLGVDFCGFITYETHRRLRKRSKDGMRKKIKKWKREYESGAISIKHIQTSWNSWLGHIHHANCYQLMKRYKEKLSFLDHDKDLEL